MPVFNPDAPDVHRADSRQLQDLIDEARAALDIIEHGHEPEDVNPVRMMAAGELIERARQRKRYTGLPESTRPGGGARPATDRDGEARPPQADPVGDLVATALSDPGPLERHLRTILRSLHLAVGELRSANAAQATATPAPTVDDKGDPGCKLHATHGMWEVVYRGERCRACYDFWLAEGIDPPETVVEIWRQGHKPTVQQVKQAKDAVLNPQPKRKRRHLRRS